MLGAHLFAPPFGKQVASVPGQGCMRQTYSPDVAARHTRRCWRCWRRGDTPPNIRSDIDDAPPDPAAPPPLARMQPRPKPWEARAPAAAAAAAPWQPAANGAHAPFLVPLVCCNPFPCWL